MIANQIKCIWLDDWVVVDYLSRTQYSVKSKNVELLIGLMLCKFCEKQWSATCVIGLPIQDKFEKEIPDNDNVSFPELDDIIKNKIEESTPIDIVIAIKKFEINQRGQRINKGMTFQIKRFGKNVMANDTDSLISFINEAIPKKYPLNSGSGLVIMMETPEEIYLKEAAEKIKNTKHPFEKIILIGMEQHRFINFYGLWPNTGQCQFDLNIFNFNF